MSAEIDYASWYPDVPPVMDTRQLAELLNTNEQIVRAYARDGTIPAHRPPGGRKFTFLRHEIFQWLLDNRYEPGSVDEGASRIKTGRLPSSHGVPSSGAHASWR